MDLAMQTGERFGATADFCALLRRNEKYALT
jgi:hypothetical protein